MTAPIKSQVQYRKTLGSSYSVSFQEACVSDIAKDQVSCECIQGTVKKDYHQCVRYTKLMRRFSDAPRLAKKLEEEAVSEKSSATEGTLSATYLHNALLSKMDKHDVLVYTRAPAAHK